MVERRWVWHAIISFGQHTRSNDVGRAMTSTHLGSTHGQTTAAVTCHHRLWTAYTAEKHWVWLYITALGLHARLNDVGRGIPSLPLGITRSQTTLQVARHHRLWTAHSVEQRRVWHDIIALGQQHTVEGHRAWHDITTL